MLRMLPLAFSGVLSDRLSAVRGSESSLCLHWRVFPIQDKPDFASHNSGTPGHAPRGCARESQSTEDRATRCLTSSNGEAEAS